MPELLMESLSELRKGIAVEEAPSTGDIEMSTFGSIMLGSSLSCSWKLSSVSTRSWLPCSTAEAISSSSVEETVCSEEERNTLRPLRSARVEKICVSTGISWLKRSESRPTGTLSAEKASASRGKTCRRG